MVEVLDDKGMAYIPSTLILAASKFVSEQLGAILNFLISAPPEVFAKFKAVQEVCRTAISVLESPLLDDARVWNSCSQTITMFSVQLKSWC